MRHRIRRRIILISGIVIGLVVFTAVKASNQPQPDPFLGLYRAELTSPSPTYAGAPFWSSAYLADIQKRPLGCSENDDINYHSAYLNVDNCIRHIVGQPNAFSHRVWLFGSSTLYNSELPDDWTIASQLQMLLPNVRVEQRTENSAVLLTQVALMKEQPVRSGDVVILFAGYADVFDYRDNKVDMIRHYQSALSQARLWTAMRGATLINIFMPTIWSKPLTTTDHATLQRLDVDWFSGQAPELLQSLQNADSRTLNLTHLLDQLRDSGPVFFDGWHPGYRATAEIARAIYGTIWQTF